ncbi:sensor histidine kinase [Schlesneria paludicola]|uniref:sensor histidine kinase n=1 Tax=Schlesneria paludicola TaxID=360056 RepID=UPI00029ACF37|nr:ATP-binding protein [Schlesneria paludicola]
MFNSIRWRLQVWYAVLLLVVVASFGAILHRLNWETRQQQADAELHRTVNTVAANMRKLVPWPSRRTRREGEPPFRPDSNGKVGSDAPRSENDGDRGVRPPELPPRSREGGPGPSPAALGPLPAAFDQLFGGEEDSRFYFLIWGRDGALMQKSDSAPELAYPNVHDEIDGVRVRKVRERREGGHVYREVIMSHPMFPMPPSPRPGEHAGERGESGIPDWNVLVGRSIDKDLAAQHQSDWLLVATGMIILAAGVLGGGWLSSRAIRPIAAMTATAESISAQNLSERINVKEVDSELGKLATVLNGTFDRLQMAFERQKQFTADASHELRTPLAVIATHTELALSRPRSLEDYRGALETCQRASHRMRSLIDALLVLARFDSAAPALKQDSVDLEPLIQDCVELVRPLAEQRGIQLESETSPCIVVGDGDKLAQVLTNLLSNAIRYNVENGRVRVTTGTDGQLAILEVTDTGIGIPGDQLELIFDRFYQVNKARSRAEGSCGLGLSICKTIVEAHGGTIRVSSELNVGTTVEVRLPLVRPVTKVAAGESLLTTILTESGVFSRVT